MMEVNLKKATGALILGCLVFSLSGCATIFRGEHRQLSIESEPKAAQVYINGIYYGRTPLRIELRPNQSYTIEFKKEGYETEVRRIKNEIGVGWIVLDVISGFVPVFIDALTGAWYDLDQKYVNAILERQQSERLND
jgi:hypothetical protein